MNANADVAVAVAVTTSQPPQPPHTHVNKQDGPDVDAIKMFVGQIPRNMDDKELRAMFEAIGPVYQLNVLRDKVTSQSKGCCFVTFYTRKAALQAQNDLHNIKTLPGMHHPIQMKPADHNETKTGIEHRKLFIGMVSKKIAESDIRLMFSPYGGIEECTVLRGPDGVSKGCAFVTYGTRQCALSAIKNMHHSQTMEGCSAPMVVKFADTQKDKEQKKIQEQMGGSMWSLPGLATVPPQYLASNTIPTLANYATLHQLGSPTMGSLGVHSLAAHLGNNTAVGLHGANLAGLSAPMMAAAGSTAGDLAPSQTYSSSMHNLAALMAANNHPLSSIGSMHQLAALSPSIAYSQDGGTSLASAGPDWRDGYTTAVPFLKAHSIPGSLGCATTCPSTMSGTAALTGSGLFTMSGLPVGTMNGSALGTTNGSGMDALSQAYSGMQQYAAGFPTFTQPNVQQQIQSASGKQSEGPEGANLFIYHLPQEFTDQDLCQTFLPFGVVLSAKVFVDKQTNLSKCFGFVSYDNPVSAQAAIQSMNGFQIGMKRLKVQLKRSKEASRPY